MTALPCETEMISKVPHLMCEIDVYLCTSALRQIVSSSGVSDLLCLNA